MTITKAAVVCRVNLNIEVFDSERYHYPIITTVLWFHFAVAGTYIGRSLQTKKNGKGCRNKKKMKLLRQYW
jgi:hypothetical protein